MKPAAFVFLGLMALALAAAPPARACIGDQYTSIHFNSGNPDFGTPPRRASLTMRGESFNRPLRGGWGDPSDSHPYFIELNGDRDSEIEAERHRQWAAFRTRAAAALAAHDWRKAKGIYREAAKTLGWTGTLRDRFEIVEWMARPGAALSPAEVAGRWKYLATLDRLDDGSPKAAQSAFEDLSHDLALSRDLRGHAAYQSASALYSTWATGIVKDEYRAESLSRFVAMAHTFPDVKPEATLIMIARAALLPSDPANQRPDVAANAIHGLLTRFPKSRFRHAALGLRARIDYLQGRYDSAASTYFALGDLDSVRWVRRKMTSGPALDQLDARLLDGYLRRVETTRRFYTYANDIGDIDYTMRVLTPAGARRFVQRLLASPDVAAAYFYYRLYHCTNKPRDLQNLARLADRIAAHDEADAARLPRILQTRLAEVYYQTDDYKRALPWANRAVHADNAQPGRDRALYVRGAVLEKLHRSRAAQADFAALLADYPTSLLRTAAHEEMALTSEDLGRLGDSLQQYFYLGYDPDIAYFLDARMTIGEIVQFLADHPRHPQRQLIRYSLGMRYLRDERLTEARQTFLHLPPAVFAALNKNRHFEDHEVDEDTASADPLKVGADLARLKRTVADAHGNNARAAALYKSATYYYTHGTLLLYNGALWQNTRAVNFGFFWNKGHSTHGDNEATYRYMYAHEVYARAQRLCLQIVREHPNSPTAPYALYRAACCARKLASFNDWWRGDNPNHFKEASRLMKRLAREYPHHPLAHHARKYAAVFYLEGGFH